MTLPIPSYVKVVIVDDQREIQDEIEALVQQQTGFIVAGKCESVKEALIVVAAVKPHLVLLDVQLGDGTGFDILSKLARSEFKVIFLTAYSEHALKAIKVGALDYLLKPIKEEELKLALNKFHQTKAPNAEQLYIAKQQYGNGSGRIVLPSQQYLYVVDFNDIVHCQSEGGYTSFHLADSSKIVMAKNIKEYEDIFPNSQFIRTHQSYIVNRQFVKLFDKEGFVVLRNGNKIPVSVRRRDDVIEFLKGFR